MRRIAVKPQIQEFPTHDPKNGLIGDCFRAAIASVLGLNIKRVPHFVRDYYGDNDGLYNAIYSYLAKHGFFMLDVLYPIGLKLLKHQNKTLNINCYHLITGIDHDGNPHVCVGLNGKLIHDPHPLHRGFVNPPNEWKILFFVALDPSINKDDSVTTKATRQQSGSIPINQYKLGLNQRRLES